ncbi:MAG: CDGSH iron-sulfur domain-containing protein [Candidatus Omnitrophica bacterium]|nr:CDGSH iron-sulfur domain-containing protein [Candidatus Omnitrophota bacterium]MCA9416194.1 CDGSH iron-sulfur domain-containing protein [Candidatus Omnitrophota bacterium]MCA9426028.1 CDGSH iron-sulfur domain-containing protein [Candidatus Omnitrophota bacterium]MCA9430791.1 CDGSH iron-sulfur domain-containing protein [Candidatus Omnitrophota bacterium]MCA9438224.1 CDGSH iron-sulfur domain-containing protein [Candidatus Omnitrophota bacterium]
MADTTQNKPFVMKVEPGKYAWCACGQSETQPYCDGSHSRCGSEKRPHIVTIEDGKNVAWCGCKQTKTPPYCDGSHSRL